MSKNKTNIKNNLTDEELAHILRTAHDADHLAVQSGELSLLKPEQFKKSMPIQLSTTGQNTISKAQTRIRRIIDGEDPTRLLIIGPCSPDFRGLQDGKIPAVLEFARQIRSTIAEIEQKNKVLVVLRAPAVKPRTAVGWGGIFSDSPSATRMLYTAMANEGIRLATEVYGQIQLDYLSDLCALTWIGARNVSAPNTRAKVADALTPVLVKHSLVAIDSAIHARSVIAAQQPVSRFDWDTGRLTIRKTRGNRHTLTILRGYEHDGKHFPNIDSETILRSCELAKQAELPCGVVIDISHSNGLKTIKGSMAAFEKVMSLMKDDKTAPHIKGYMTEAYLGGKGNGYGESITDETIDVQTAIKMMKRFAAACNPTDNEK